MRGRRQGLWLACLIAAAGSLRGETPYAGSKSCAACHPAQFQRQSASAHAAALFRTRDHPLADAFLKAGKLERKPGYRFEFFLSDGLRTRIHDAVDVMELPMEWAFGSGAQAVTFVTKVNQDWYVEHYATYYSALHAWGPTPGQADLHPASLPEAAGLLYKTLDPATGIAGCFECHSTGPLSFTPTGDARPTELGVTCETCHDAGAAHGKNPRRSAMQNPAKLSAAQLNEFCGRCHRPPAAKGVEIDWNYAWNVRHQPVYLSQSACFRKSGGALSCLTCHDPHEAAGSKPAADYNARCHRCHSIVKAVCRQQTLANCIDCHMPSVSPQSPLRFTNHWIGVYGDGAKLKPDRRISGIRH